MTSKAAFLTSLYCVSLAGSVLPSCYASFKPVDTLKPRATLESDCPADQLSYTPIDGDCGTKLGEMYQCSIMVKGCGKKYIYVHPQGGPWILNSRS